MLQALGQRIVPSRIDLLTYDRRKAFWIDGNFSPCAPQYSTPFESTVLDRDCPFLIARGSRGPVPQEPC